MDPFENIMREHALAGVDVTDKASVYARLARYGTALEFLPAYQSDEAAVLLAIGSDPVAYRFADPYIQQDVVFAMKAVHTAPAVYLHLSTPLQEHIDIALEALPRLPYLLRYAPDSIKANYKVVAYTLSEDPSLYPYISDIIKSGDDIPAKVVKAIAKQSVELDFIATKSYFNDTTNEEIDIHLNENT